MLAFHLHFQGKGSFQLSQLSHELLSYLSLSLLVETMNGLEKAALVTRPPQARETERSGELGQGNFWG